MSLLVLPAVDVVRATPRTRIIRLALDGRRFPFIAGQAVNVGLHDGRMRKPYSLACSPGQAEATGMLELLAQVEEGDAPDPHLERAVHGTRLDVSEPFGTFGLPEPLQAHRLLLVAGGTGIAPLRSILWDTLERGLDADITLLYSARSVDEFAYGDELTQLAVEGRLRLIQTITRADVDGWPGRRGRIDGGLIAELITSPDTHCLVCGPAAFVEDITALATAAGVPPPLITT